MGEQLQKTGHEVLAGWRRQGQGENGVVERLEDPVRLKSVSIGRKRYDQEEKSQRRTLLFKMSEVEVL